MCTEKNWFLLARLVLQDAGRMQLLRDAPSERTVPGIEPDHFYPSPGLWRPQVAGTPGSRRQPNQIHPINNLRRPRESLLSKSTQERTGNAHIGHHEAVYDAVVQREYYVQLRRWVQPTMFMNFMAKSGQESLPAGSCANNVVAECGTTLGLGK